MYIVGFYYKTVSRCTVLWISKSVVSLTPKGQFLHCTTIVFSERYLTRFMQFNFSVFMLCWPIIPSPDIYLFISRFYNVSTSSCAHLKIQALIFLLKSSPQIRSNLPESIPREHLVMPYWNCTKLFLICCNAIRPLSANRRDEMQSKLLSTETKWKQFRGN